MRHTQLLLVQSAALAGFIGVHAQDPECPERELIEYQPIKVVTGPNPPDFTKTTLTRTIIITETPTPTDDPGYVTTTVPGTASTPITRTVPPENGRPGTIVIENPPEWVTTTVPGTDSVPVTKTIPPTNGTPGSIIVEESTTPPVQPPYVSTTVPGTGSVPITRTIPPTGTTPGTIVVEESSTPPVQPPYVSTTVPGTGSVPITRTIPPTGTTPGTIVVEESSTPPAITPPYDTTTVPGTGTGTVTRTIPPVGTTPGTYVIETPPGTVTTTQPWTGVGTTTTTRPPSGTQPATVIVETPACTPGTQWAFYDFEAGSGPGQIPYDPDADTMEDWPRDGWSIQTAMSGQTPDYSGTTGRFGWNVDTDPCASPATIYGQTTTADIPYTVIQQIGYFHPTEEGTYTFGTDNPDDAIYYWFGDDAVSGYNNTNADAYYYYTSTDSTYSYTVDASNVNTYIPYRLLYVNVQDCGRFQVTVNSPSGTLIADGTTDDTTGTFVNDCDTSVDAPQFGF